MERGQGGDLRERLLSDAPNGVGQGDRGDADTDEGSAINGREGAEIGAQVDLPEPGVVTERVGRDLPGSPKVDTGEVRHLPERRGPHRLKAVGQGDRGQRRPFEGLSADVTQRRGQRHRIDLSLEESHVINRLDPILDCVGSARVPRRGVGDQVREILRIQDAVNPLVVRVAAVHLDAGEGWRVREGTHQLIRGNAGSQPHRLQLGHVDEGVGGDPLQGSGQRQFSDAGIGEDSAADLSELGGTTDLVLEGDYLKRGCVEGFIPDAAHARGDLDRPDVGATEGVRTDGAHSPRDRHVHPDPAVPDEGTVLVDHEVVGVPDHHLEGDRGGLHDAVDTRHARAQRAVTPLVGRQDAGGRSPLVGGDRAERRRTHRPSNRAPLEGGGEEGVEERRVSLAEHEGSGRQLDPGLLGDGAHLDGHGREHGGRYPIGGPNRCLAGADPRHEAIAVDR